MCVGVGWGGGLGVGRYSGQGAAHACSWWVGWWVGQGGGGGLGVGAAVALSLHCVDNSHRGFVKRFVLRRSSPCQPSTETAPRRRRRQRARERAQLRRALPARCCCHRPAFTACLTSSWAAALGNQVLKGRPSTKEWPLPPGSESVLCRRQTAADHCREYDLSTPPKEEA